MSYEIRLSNSSDKKKLSEMIHEIYAKELGQYAVNSENSIIDKYDSNNNYIVAYDGENLVGMVSITRPSTGKISTLSRVPSHHEIHRFTNDIAEVRLLSIKKEYRSKGLYKNIIFKIMQFCDLYNIDRILISAIENKADMYKLMGFMPISKPVIENKCVYIPMQLHRSDFCNSSYYKVLDGLRLYDKYRSNIKVVFLSVSSFLNPSILKFISKKKRVIK